MKMRWTLLPVFLMLALPTAKSFAHQVSLNSLESRIKGRCSDDLLNSPDAVGRNAWARKCNIIDQEEEAFYNARGFYVTFSNINAPFSEQAGCIDHAILLGMCSVAGCYTPNQHILFAGRYTPIAQASESQIATVTALTDHFLFPLKSDFFAEEAIESFIVGDEIKYILVIQTQNGLKIEVTSNHPMVDAHAHIIAAKNVTAYKTNLLTAKGPSQVIAVLKKPYQGLVWNIQPQTKRTLGNIHIAEGFLTGSVRYQNEWANDAYRLHLRMQTPISQN